MVGKKYCLMCGMGKLAPWESACNYCWDKAREHDKCWECKGFGHILNKIDGKAAGYTPCTVCDGYGFKGKWRSQLILLNHIREFLRSCGMDLFDSPW